jgi:hypothetical protein
MQAWNDQATSLSLRPTLGQQDTSFESLPELDFISEVFSLVISELHLYRLKRLEVTISTL